MTYDAIVIGGGPAGSAVARQTAQAGLNVLVLEEHTTVGRPLQCSGFVTPRTLDRLGAGAERLVLNRVKGATVFGPRDSRLDLGGDRVRAIALDRIAMDAFLAEQASSAGVTLSLGSRVEHIERVDGHVELRVRRGRRATCETLKTRLLVGADGWNSVVARWIGAPRGPLVAAVSFDAVAPAHPADMARVYVGNEVAPGWFGWTIPLGEGQVRVGAGCDTAMSTTKPAYLLRALRRRLERDLGTVRVVSASGGFIPLFHEGQGGCSATADNVMLVGDAARQVKPTSGGGIYTALVAAEHASQAAIGAAQRGDFSREALSGYERGWRGALLDEFRRAGDVRSLYLGLSDGQMERLLSLLRLPGFQYLIRRFGDIDYQSRLYARLYTAGRVLRSVLPLPAVLPSHWGNGR